MTRGPEVPLHERVVWKVLERRAAVQRDDSFVTFAPGQARTYGEVAAAAARVASGLAALGLQLGDHLGLFLPNGPAFIDAYFAAAKRGVVCVPFNTAYVGYLLEYVLADTACRVVIAERDLVAQLARAEHAAPRLETVIVVGASPGEIDALGRAFRRIRLRAYAELKAMPLDDGPSPARYADTNCVIYTSGTTGPSKGVLISNAHAVAKAQEFLEICRFGSDDVLYSPLPLFHSFSLLRGVLSVLLVGGSVVLRPRFSASVYWEDVRRYGVTVGHCVFSIPLILAKAPPDLRDREHTLRCLFNARADAAFEERFGVKLLESYGLTEANNAIYNRYDEAPRPGSCGRVSDDWEVRLLDDDDQEVAAGLVGEIALRPRLPFLVMSGYLNKAEATVAAYRNLWFHTGDLASVDADGFYTFRDRKKDAIRRRGENISSWEIEQALLAHPLILEAAALPYPSSLGDDEVRVVVVPRDGVTLSAADVAAFCAERLPEYMVPRFIEVVAALPKTPNGRVEKYRLRSAGLGLGHLDRGEDAGRARRLPDRS